MGYTLSGKAYVRESKEQYLFITDLTIRGEDLLRQMNIRFAQALTRKPEPADCEANRKSAGLAPVTRSNPRAGRSGDLHAYLPKDTIDAQSSTRFPPPWIGAYITLAVFEILSDCTLVDCSQDKLTTLDLLMREKEATEEEMEQAVWGDIAKAFSTPLTRDDTFEEYWTTQCLAERLEAVGYDGVAYQSALGKGRNFALFDLDAAHSINGTLFKTEAVEYKFEQANNTYYIPKYYPEWARKSGIDPESEVPYSVRIVAYLIREGDHPGCTSQLQGGPVRSGPHTQ